MHTNDTGHENDTAASTAADNTANNHVCRRRPFNVPPALVGDINRDRDIIDAYRAETDRTDMALNWIIGGMLMPALRYLATTIVAIVAIVVLHH